MSTAAFLISNAKDKHPFFLLFSLHTLTHISPPYAGPGEIPPENIGVYSKKSPNSPPRPCAMARMACSSPAPVREARRQHRHSICSTLLVNTNTK